MGVTLGTISPAAGNGISTAETWLKGVVLGADVDEIRKEALPRPLVFETPIYSFQGELQDVHGVGGARLSGMEIASRPNERQDIFGSMLDQNGTARISGLCWKGKLPRYCRVGIFVNFGYWIFRDPAAAALVSTRAGSFNIRIKEPASAVSTPASAIRSAVPLDAGNRGQREHMMTWHVPTAATLNGDTEIWVDFDEDGTEFWTKADPNAHQLVIGNTSMVVRVWKDYTS